MSIDETRVREPQRDRRSDDRYGRYDEPALDWVSLREGWEQERAREQAKNPPPVLQHGPVVGENHFVGDPVHDNKNYAMGKMRREIANSYYNHSLIWLDYRDGRGKDIPVGKFSGPALMIGSGPTLDLAKPFLKDWKGAIFCTSSQATTLVRHGCRGFFITGIDPVSEDVEIDKIPGARKAELREILATPDIYEREAKALINDGFQYRRTILKDGHAIAEFIKPEITGWEELGCAIIVHPGIDPGLIQYWRGEKYYYRIQSPGLIFYREIVPAGYWFIRQQILAFSCSVPGQMGLANMMGFSPLIFVGCDFGYPDMPDCPMQERFEKEWFEDGEWKKRQKCTTKFPHKGKVLFRNGVMSDSLQATYKMTVFNMARLTMADVFVAGHGGVYEYPQVSLEELVGNGCKIPLERFLSKRQKIEIADRYLAKRGTFSMEWPDGTVQFVVFPNQQGGICTDKKELEPLVREYVARVNRNWTASGKPGVLRPDEEVDRINHLLNDEYWEKKEQEWGWPIKEQNTEPSG